LTDQYVSSDTVAHHQELPNCKFPLSHDSGRQRQTWVKPEALITV